jgi:hypothetical protein
MPKEVLTLPYSYKEDLVALINTAEFLHHFEQPVPVDILARLLDAGIDISKYK